MVKKMVALTAVAAMASAGLTGCLSGNANSAKVPTTTQQETQKAAENQKIIRISFAGGENPPIMTTMKEFEKNFEEQTQGRYDIQIYANGVLGDDLKATEQVKAGELEAVVTSPSPIGTIVKELMVFDLPYIFTSEEQADTILSGTFAEYLDGKMEEKGLLNMAWYEDGFRQLTNSKKEVVTPEDVKGMKIRTMENPIHLAAWRSLGANPTPMAFTDVFTALQQHVIDGQENPFPTIYDGKFYEVQKYCSTTCHVYSPFIFLYNEKLFNELPEEDQKIFRETAKKLEEDNRRITRESAVECRKEMETAGMQVTELTVEQKQVFQDILKPTWGDFTEIFGEESLDKLTAELDKLPKE